MMERTNERTDQLSAELRSKQASSLRSPETKGNKRKVYQNRRNASVGGGGEGGGSGGSSSGSDERREASGEQRAVASMLVLNRKFPTFNRLLKIIRWNPKQFSSNRTCTKNIFFSRRSRKNFYVLRGRNGNKSSWP